MQPYRDVFWIVISKVSRMYEVISGVVLSLFGLLAAAFAALASLAAMRNGTFGITDAALGCFLLLLASWSGITAFRLLSGRGRKVDGGLFPPWFLRVLGVGFFAALVWFAVPGAVNVTFLERINVLVVAPILAVGCFYLANRQKRSTKVTQI